MNVDPRMGFRHPLGVGDLLSTFTAPAAILTNAGTAAYSVATASPGSLPSWCGWLPFADFASACKVPSPAQLTQQALSNLGPAATPETVAAVEAAVSAVPAEYASDYPADYAQYETAVESPLVSALLGTGTAGQLAAGVSTGLGAIPVWVWAGAALAAAWALSRR